jgi:hypothetical protein
MSDTFQISPAGVVTIGHTASNGVVTYFTIPTTTDLTDQTSAATASLASAVSATATTDGLTTGTLPWTTGQRSLYATVTSDDANKIIVLPSVDANGVTVRLFNGATGYELRSEIPGTIPINGGTGTNAESAIGANVLVTCVRVLGKWLCTNTATDGTVSATEVAAP